MGKTGTNRYGIYIPVEMYLEKGFPLKYGDTFTLRFFTKEKIIVLEKEEPKEKEKK